MKMVFINVKNNVKKDKRCKTENVFQIVITTIMQKDKTVYNIVNQINIY